MHYKLLPCEKLHYRAYQGLMELSALTLGWKGECSQMDCILPEASLKQGEDNDVSGDGLKRSIIINSTLSVFDKSLKFNLEQK